MALYQDLSRFGIANRSYSVAEWQELERRTGEKFEYHNGRLVHWRAMAGGAPAHALLASNASGVLYKAFTEDEARYAECHTYNSDLQLKIPEGRRYVYPDAAVVCGSPKYDETVATAILNPLVVVEVLSPSSFEYDAGKKFSYYAKLDSLRDYVLVTQDARQVEVRSRVDSGSLWEIVFYGASDVRARLPSLDLALPLDGLYRGVETPFDEEPGEEGATVPA